MVLALLFLSGLALGASRTPRDMMVKDAAPPGQIGKVFGFVSAGLPLGAAVTPVPFGFLIDQGRPELVLVLVAALLLLSLLCAGTARAAPRGAAARGDRAGAGAGRTPPPPVCARGQCTSDTSISCWCTAAIATSRSPATAIGVPSAAWMAIGRRRRS